MHESINAQKIISIIVFTIAVVACSWLVFTVANFSGFSFVKLFILLAGGSFVFIILLQEKSLEFTITVVLLLLPFIGFGIPPRRFGYNLFDLFALLVVCLLFHYFFWQKKRINLIPDRYVFVFLLLVIPSVFMGISPFDSILGYVKLVFYYVFFICLRFYLSEDSQMANLIKYITYSLFIISLAIFFERLTGINLSTSSKNLNAYTEMLGIYRVAGFFQDPQKAAQFIGTCLVFLIVLLFQKEVVKEKEKFFIYTTIVLSCLSLFLTVSRISIVSTVLILVPAAIFFNKNKRKILLYFILTFILLVGMANKDFIKSVFLETSLGTRMMLTTQGTEGRYKIWKDSWIIIKKHPWTGIGPGNYQEYIVRLNPSLRNAKYIPSQPESGYLKILYETGLVGFAGFIYFLFGIGKEIFRRIFTNDIASKGGIGLAAGFGIIVFVLSFITLFTVSDSRNAVLFIILYTVLSFKKTSSSISSV